ncbi:MAG: enoyl-CoA hydratase/isomerase family protein [Pseudonocardia sp.]|nr:enoyl-CoA hydratase/isomerase family protein [Pseudonocardia sp.]
MIEWAEVDGIAVLTLARPPVNALDVDLCTAVADGLRGPGVDGARAVVLTGAGRAFSAGVDLHGVVAGGPEYARRLLPALADLFRTAFTLSVPLVAAVNGHAIAGGCVLAACADVVLMSEGRIGLPEVRVGVPFPRSALEVMRYAVGEPAARRLILGAETMRPADAAALGLVDRVVAAADLQAAAHAAAAELADRMPADTFAHTKAQLQRDAVARMDTQVDEDTAAAELWAERVRDGRIAGYMRAVTGR